VILEFQALGSVVSPIQSRGGEKRVGQEKKEKERKQKREERERERLFNEKKSPIK